MNLTEVESIAISSKCYILSGKTIERLEQINPFEFPTEASQLAREILLNVLRQLHDPQRVVAASPAVLYKCLLDMQDLVSVLELSSVNKIFWPLVGYCDQLWKGFFGEGSPRIFYSVTSKHNYSIFDFSGKVALLLNGVLPKKEISTLMEERRLYCLQLASTEDYNLPLYANIGHEFGHAVFWTYWDNLIPVFMNVMDNVLNNIAPALNAYDPKQTSRRLVRAQWVLLGVAAESFCDMVAATLMGPAFYLSLFEISWGQDKNTFSVLLTPKATDIVGYPSFAFRLHCIRKWAHVEEFIKSAQADFQDLTDSQHLYIECLSTIPDGHDQDRVRVDPPSDQDTKVLSEVLNSHLSMIKDSLNKYQENCQPMIEQWLPPGKDTLSCADVSALLKRLEFNVLPNIVPDSIHDPLLGRPASFSAILNTSALRRMRLLSKNDCGDFSEMSHKSSIVERLTAKALEVSYVQREFKKWRKT
jgi:hypothetical protein